MADHLLDVRGLLCPIPILKAAKLIKGLGEGETIEVLATDPGSVADFESFCEVKSHTLLESSITDEEFRFVIRKGM